MWRYPKTQIDAAQSFSRCCRFEGLPKPQLTCLVGRAQTGYEPRRFVHVTGLGVSMKRLDRHSQRLQPGRRKDQDSCPGLGFRPLLVLERDDPAFVVAHPEGAPTLAPHYK